MKTELSPAAEFALQQARTESMFEEIDLLRLLQTLLADDESRPAELILAAGGQLESIRQELITHPPKMTYSRKFLGLAREAAIGQGEATVTGEYLLWTLLQQAPEYRRLIEQHGADLSQFLAQRELQIIKTLEEPPLHVPTIKQIDAGAERICDVNANRIRESLRILDDYARFVEDNPGYTNQIKHIRHDFVAVLKAHPSLVNLEMRHTDGDVGTSITTSSESHRASSRDVALVNVKRLQEALRSLEEFSKTIDPTASPKIEQIRYRCYTLEREMFVESPRIALLRTAKLYLLLTSQQCPHGWLETAKAAIAGGVQVIQLREKSGDDRSLLQKAETLRRLTSENNVLFIINDRLDVTKLVDADGVHLGQDDLPLNAARRVLTPNTLVGISTHSAPQLSQAMVDHADYVGLGPTFPSTTKQFEAFAGLTYLEEAVVQCSLPAFAIGGINHHNLKQVLATGCQRIAVSAAITQAANPEVAAKEFRRQLDA